MSDLKPIFYDQYKSRWRWATRIFWVCSVVFSVIFFVASFSIAINPILPSLGLPNITRLPPVSHLLFHPPIVTQLTPTERRFKRTERRLLKTIRASAHIAQPVLPPPTVRGGGEIIGFFVNWDDASFASLKKNIGGLDRLIPEWLHLTSGSGDVTPDNLNKQNQVLDYVRARRPDLLVMPLVNNYDSNTEQWDSKVIAAMLSDANARKRTIANLLNYVRRYRLAGVSVDFESVPDNQQGNFEIFMKELYGTFHSANLVVSMDVPAQDPAFDYKNYARSADYLILMAYDEHCSSSKAGAVASQTWFENSLTRIFNEVPANKIIIALANYGYDWPDKSNNATELTFQEAIQVASESEGTVVLDDATMNPTFDYYDNSHNLHHVWLLDAITVFNQIVAAQEYHPRGFALWHLGSEDPTVWQVIPKRTHLAETEALSLKTMIYGYDIDYEGTGEVVRVTGKPKTGSRDIIFDPDQGLITTEEVRSFPAPYVISRWGGTNARKIALTFDDGPDPQYTPQILATLEHFHVPATFFIIGSYGALHEKLLKQIVADGNEVGNHTFTHPNIAQISSLQGRLELNATERMFESVLGRGSLLFRPPYGEDYEPDTPDKAEPLTQISALGYYTIGMGIDPSDWSHPGIDRIVDRVLTAAEKGTGNVVLLHDGGGDRTQTVAALPRIIQGLQAKGVQLVAVSDLLGLSRDAVMPPINDYTTMVADSNNILITFIGYCAGCLYYIFIIGIVLGILRFGVIMAFAILEWRASRYSKFDRAHCLPVSVVIPAYNESKVIGRTISSIANSNYPDIEIIVVDDGSSDDTFAVAEKFAREDGRVQVLHQTNAGKAAALNNGVAAAKNQILIALDADTLFESDTITGLARHFSDARVGAVAGNAKVGNRVNTLSAWQALEYVTGQNLDRRAFALINCITIVPGAVGAWRRELILRAGGFQSDTLAEDADLTLRILRLGYRINYDDKAIALTEVPETSRDFFKQRFRWMFGVWQTAWKHRDALLRKKYGALGMVGLPNIYLFQIIFQLLSPALDLMLAVSLLTLLWRYLQQVSTVVTNTFEHILFYYALFLLIDYLASAMAFLLEKEEDWRLLAWLPFQRFFYRQFMCYIAVKSLLTIIKGSFIAWEKLERRNSITEKLNDKYLKLQTRFLFTDNRSEAE